MKLLGGLLLTAGFLAGAYVAVAEVDRVDWTYYGLCAGLMIAGMIVLRLARSQEAGAAGQKHEENIRVLERSLESLVAKVAELESSRDDEDQLVMHDRIDAELLDDLNDFVEARESMIPRLGMQNYADIMSPFATGERLLNRAWSASADGYVDEVRKCITQARQELEQARELLAGARP